MADPTRYDPGYSFTGYQTSNPSAPLPAPHVDDELFKIGIALGTTIDAVESIRRSDGALKNGIVTADALATSAIDALTGDSAANAATATAQATIATAQATIATTEAGVATAQASSASNNAVIAQQAAASLDSAVAVINALGYVLDWGIITDPAGTPTDYGSLSP